MASVQEINKKYLGQFTQAFTAQDAAIVFALAVTKDGKIRVCQTTDLTGPELKDAVRKWLIAMGG